jgi:hypothetical protein
MYLRRFSASSSTLPSAVVLWASQLQVETMAAARSISLFLSLRRHLRGGGSKRFALPLVSLLSSVNPSRSPTQLEASGTRYGSATTARVTLFSRMVWRSRSCACLPLSRLHWRRLLNLLVQIHSLPPAIPSCFGGAPLCRSRRDGWLASGASSFDLWGSACHPSQSVVSGCPERLTQGALGRGSWTLSGAVSAFTTSVT